MDVQKSLFPHVVLAEQELEQRLQHLYAPLWQMIRDPFDEFRARRASGDKWFQVLTEGEAAQCLRPQIVQRARELFAGTNVRVEKRRQQMYLDVGGELAITPKKLRQNRRKDAMTFSGYKTKQSMQYWRQQPVDGIPHLPRTIVGYQFVDLMTDIKIWVAHPYGRTLRTCFLMPDQSGQIVGHYVPAEAIEPNEDRGFEVKPKKERRKLGGT